MVEVFRTNVSNPQQADELIGLLHHLLPGSTINFDLEDCDRVLRIAAPEIATAKVIELLRVHHYECAILS